MKKIPYIIRPLALILIVALLWQSVAWANPELFQRAAVPTHKLQAPSFFSYAHGQNVLKVALVNVIKRIPDIREFNYRLMPNVAGLSVEMDFSRKYIEGEDVVVPCSVTSQRSCRLMEAVITPSQDISLRKSGKRDLPFTTSSVERGAPCSRDGLERIDRIEQQGNLERIRTITRKLFPEKGAGNRILFVISSGRNIYTLRDRLSRIIHSHHLGGPGAAEVVSVRSARDPGLYSIFNNCSVPGYLMSKKPDIVQRVEESDTLLSDAEQKVYDDSVQRSLEIIEAKHDLNTVGTLFVDDIYALGLIPIIKSKYPHIKIVWTNHRDFSDVAEITKRFLQHHLQGADVIAGWSKADFPAYPHGAKETIRDRAHVLPIVGLNPLDCKNIELTKTYIDYVRGKYAISDRRRIIFQLGRITTIKDFYMTVRAYVRMKRAWPEVRGEVPQLVLACPMASGIDEERFGHLVKYKEHLVRNGTISDNDIITIPLVLPTSKGTYSGEDYTSAKKELLDLAKEHEGDYRHYLRNVSAALSPGTEFGREVLNHLEVNALQRIADLGLHVSMYESFGVAINELLWKGKPTIASTTGGIPEQYPEAMRSDFLMDIDQSYKEKIRDLELKYETGAYDENVVQEVLGSVQDPALELAGKMAHFFMQSENERETTGQAFREYIRERYLMLKCVLEHLRLLEYLKDTPAVQKTGKPTLQEKIGAIDEYYRVRERDGRLSVYAEVKDTIFTSSAANILVQIAEEFIGRDRGKKVFIMGSGTGKSAALFSLYSDDVKGVEFGNELLAQSDTSLEELSAGRWIDRSSIDLRYGDFWQKSLEGYDLLYIFWPYSTDDSPQMARDLAEKAVQQMKPGAVLVVHCYAPAKVTELDRLLERVDLPYEEEGLSRSIHAYKAPVHRTEALQTLAKTRQEKPPKPEAPNMARKKTRDRISKAVAEIQLSRHLEDPEGFRREIETFLRRFVRANSEYEETILSELKNLRVVSKEHYLGIRKYIEFGAAIVLLILDSILGIYPLLTKDFLPLLNNRMIILLLMGAAVLVYLGIESHLDQKNRHSYFVHAGYKRYLIALSGKDTPTAPVHEFGHCLVRMLEIEDWSKLWGMTLQILMYGDAHLDEELLQYKHSVEKVVHESQPYPTEEDAKREILKELAQREKEYSRSEGRKVYNRKDDKKTAIYLATEIRRLFPADDTKAFEFLVSLFRKQKGNKHVSLRKSQELSTLEIIDGIEKQDRLHAAQEIAKSLFPEGTKGGKVLFVTPLARNIKRTREALVEYLTSNDIGGMERIAVIDISGERKLSHVERQGILTNYSMPESVILQKAYDTIRDVKAKEASGTATKKDIRSRLKSEDMRDRIESDRDILDKQESAAYARDIHVCLEKVIEENNGTLNDVAVIFLDGIFSLGLTKAIKERFPHIKVVWTSRNDISKAPSNMQRFHAQYLGYADAYVGWSREAFPASLRREARILPVAGIEPLYCKDMDIDLPESYINHVIEKYHEKDGQYIDRNRKIILQLARYAPSKDFFMAMRAYAKMVSEWNTEHDGPRPQLVLACPFKSGNKAEEQLGHLRRFRQHLLVHDAIKKNDIVIIGLRLSQWKEGYDKEQQSKDTLAAEQLKREVMRRYKRDFGISLPDEQDERMDTINYLEVNVLKDIADLGIHPSIFEAFALVIAEQHWKRTPTIATRFGGIPEQYPGALQKDFLVDVDETYTECVRDLKKVYEAPEYDDQKIQGILTSITDPADALRERMLDFFRKSDDEREAIRGEFKEFIRERYLILNSILRHLELIRDLRSGSTQKPPKPEAPNMARKKTRDRISKAVNSIHIDAHLEEHEKIRETIEQFLREHVAKTVHEKPILAALPHLRITHGMRQDRKLMFKHLGLAAGIAVFAVYSFQSGIPSYFSLIPGVLTAVLFLFRALLFYFDSRSAYAGYYIDSPWLVRTRFYILLPDEKNIESDVIHEFGHFLVDVFGLEDGNRSLGEALRHLEFGEGAMGYQKNAYSRRRSLQMSSPQAIEESREELRSYLAAEQKHRVTVLKKNLKDLWNAITLFAFDMIPIYLRQVKDSLVDIIFADNITAGATTGSAARDVYDDTKDGTLAFRYLVSLYTEEKAPKPRKRPVDYTQISIKRGIKKLAPQAIVGTGILSILFIAEMMAAGSLGVDAIATVAVASTISSIMFIPITAISGARSLISHARGARRYNAAQRYAFNSVLATVAWSGIIALLGFTFAPGFLGLIGGTEQGAVAAALPYFRIVVFAFIARALEYVMHEDLRAAGDADQSLRIVTMIATVNLALLALSALHIIPFFGLTLQNIGWAMLVSRAAGAALGVWYLFLGGSHHLRIAPKNMRPSLKIQKEIARVGFFQSVHTMSLMGYNAILFRLIASFGQEAKAAFGIVSKIIGFVSVPGHGLGAANATLVGENLGAGKTKRADTSLRMTMVCGAIAGLAFSLISLVFAPVIVGFFTDSAAVLSIARTFLMIASLSFWGTTLKIIMQSAFLGAKDTKSPAWISGAVFAASLIAAFVSVYLLGAGLMAIWIIVACSELANLILLMVWWNYQKRHGLAERVRARSGNEGSIRFTAFWEGQTFYIPVIEKKSCLEGGKHYDQALYGGEGFRGILPIFKAVMEEERLSERAIEIRVLDFSPDPTVTANVLYMNDGRKIVVINKAFVRSIAFQLRNGYRSIILEDEVTGKTSDLVTSEVFSIAIHELRAHVRYSLPERVAQYHRGDRYNDINVAAMLYYWSMNMRNFSIQGVKNFIEDNPQLIPAVYRPYYLNKVREIEKARKEREIPRPYKYHSGYSPVVSVIYSDKLKEYIDTKTKYGVDRIMYEWLLDAAYRVDRNEGEAEETGSGEAEEADADILVGQIEPLIELAELILEEGEETIEFSVTGETYSCEVKVDTTMDEACRLVMVEDSNHSQLYINPDRVSEIPGAESNPGIISQGVMLYRLADALGRHLEFDDTTRHEAGRALEELFAAQSDETGAALQPLLEIVSAGPEEVDLFGEVIMVAAEKGEDEEEADEEEEIPIVDEIDIPVTSQEEAYVLIDEMTEGNLPGHKTFLTCWPKTAEEYLTVAQPFGFTARYEWRETVANAITKKFLEENPPECERSQVKLPGHTLYVMTSRIVFPKGIRIGDFGFYAITLLTADEHTNNAFEAALESKNAERVRQHITSSLPDIIDFPMAVMTDYGVNKLADIMSRSTDGSLDLEEREVVRSVFISGEEAIRAQEAYAAEIAAQRSVEHLNGELSSMNMLVQACKWSRAWAMMKKKEAQEQGEEPKWRLRYTDRWAGKVQEIEDRFRAHRDTVALGYAQERSAAGEHRIAQGIIHTYFGEDTRNAEARKVLTSAAAAIAVEDAAKSKAEVQVRADEVNRLLYEEGLWDQAYDVAVSAVRDFPDSGKAKELPDLVGRTAREGAPGHRAVRDWIPHKERVKLSQLGRTHMALVDAYNELEANRPKMKTRQYNRKFADLAERYKKVTNEFIAHLLALPETVWERINEECSKRKMLLSGGVELAGWPDTLDDLERVMSHMFAPEVTKIAENGDLGDAEKAPPLLPGQMGMGSQLMPGQPDMMPQGLFDQPGVMPQGLPDQAGALPPLQDSGAGGSPLDFTARMIQGKAEEERQRKQTLARAVASLLGYLMPEFYDEADPYKGELRRKYFAGESEDSRIQETAETEGDSPQARLKRLFLEAKRTTSVEEATCLITEGLRACIEGDISLPFLDRGGWGAYPSMSVPMAIMNVGARPLMSPREVAEALRENPVYRRVAIRSRDGMSIIRVFMGDDGAFAAPVSKNGIIDIYPLNAEDRTKTKGFEEVETIARDDTEWAKMLDDLEASSWDEEGRAFYVGGIDYDFATRDQVVHLISLTCPEKGDDERAAIVEKYWERQTSELAEHERRKEIYTQPRQARMDAVSRRFYCMAYYAAEVHEYVAQQGRQAQDEVRDFMKMLREPVYRDIMTETRVIALRDCLVMNDDTIDRIINETPMHERDYQRCTFMLQKAVQALDGWKRVSENDTETVHAPWGSIVAWDYEAPRHEIEGERAWRSDLWYEAINLATALVLYAIDGDPMGNMYFKVYESGHVQCSHYAYLITRFGYVPVIDHEEFTELVARDEARSLCEVLPHDGTNSPVLVIHLNTAEGWEFKTLLPSDAVPEGEHAKLRVLLFEDNGRLVTDNEPYKALMDGTDLKKDENGVPLLIKELDEHRAKVVIAHVLYDTERFTNVIISGAQEGTVSRKFAEDILDTMRKQANRKKKSLEDDNVLPQLKKAKAKENVLKRVHDLEAAGKHAAALKKLSKALKTRPDDFMLIAEKKRIAQVVTRNRLVRHAEREAKGDDLETMEKAQRELGSYYCGEEEATKPLMKEKTGSDTAAFAAWTALGAAMENVRDRNRKRQEFLAAAEKLVDSEDLRGATEKVEEASGYGGHSTDTNALLTRIGQVRQQKDLIASIGAALDTVENELARNRLDTEDMDEYDKRVQGEKKRIERVDWKTNDLRLEARAKTVSRAVASKRASLAKTVEERKTAMENSLRAIREELKPLEVPKEILTLKTKVAAQEGVIKDVPSKTVRRDLAGECRAARRAIDTKATAKVMERVKEIPESIDGVDEEIPNAKTPEDTKVLRERMAAIKGAINQITIPDEKKRLERIYGVVSRRLKEKREKIQSNIDTRVTRLSGLMQIEKGKFEPDKADMTKKRLEALREEIPGIPSEDARTDMHTCIDEALAWVDNAIENDRKAREQQKIIDEISEPFELRLNSVRNWAVTGKRGMLETGATPEHVAKEGYAFLDRLDTTVEVAAKFDRDKRGTLDDAVAAKRKALNEAIRDREAARPAESRQSSEDAEGEALVFLGECEEELSTAATPADLKALSERINDMPAGTWENLDSEQRRFVRAEQETLTARVKAAIKKAGKAPKKKAKKKESVEIDSEDEKRIADIAKGFPAGYRSLNAAVTNLMYAKARGDEHGVRQATEDAAKELTKTKEGITPAMQEQYKKALTFKPTKRSGSFGEFLYRAYGVEGYSPFVHAPVFEELGKVGVPYAAYWLLSRYNEAMPNFNFYIFAGLLTVLGFLYIVLHILNDRAPPQEVKGFFGKLKFYVSELIHLTPGERSLIFGAPFEAFLAGYVLSFVLVLVPFLAPYAWTSVPASMYVHYRVNKRVAIQRQRGINAGYAIFNFLQGPGGFTSLVLALVGLPFAILAARFANKSLSGKKPSRMDAGDILFLAGMSTAALYGIFWNTGVSTLTGVVSAILIFIIFLRVWMPDPRPGMSLLRNPFKYIWLKTIKLVKDEYTYVRNNWKSVGLVYLVLILAGVAVNYVTPIRSALEAYHLVTLAHPWLTAIIPAAVILGLLTEGISQIFLWKKTPLSLRIWRLSYKTLMFALFGALMNVYLPTLDWIVPATGAWPSLKVWIDQFVFSTFIFYTLYCAAIILFEYLYKTISKKHASHIDVTRPFFANWREKVYQRVIISLSVWVVAHTYNFYFLETAERIAFVIVVAFIYFVVMSMYDRISMSKDKQDSSAAGDISHKPTAVVKIGTTEYPVPIRGGATKLGDLLKEIEYNGVNALELVSYLLKTHESQTQIIVDGEDYFLNSLIHPDEIVTITLPSDMTEINVKGDREKHAAVRGFMKKIFSTLHAHHRKRPPKKEGVTKLELIAVLGVFASGGIIGLLVFWEQIVAHWNLAIFVVLVVTALIVDLIRGGKIRVYTDPMTKMHDEIEEMTLRQDTLEVYIEFSERVIESVSEKKRLDIVIPIFDDASVLSEDEHPKGADTARETFEFVEEAQRMNPKLDIRVRFVDDGGKAFLEYDGQVLSAAEIVREILKEDFPVLYKSGKVTIEFLQDAIDENLRRTPDKRNPVLAGLHNARKDSKKGGAVEYGMWRSYQEGADYVVIIDADESTDRRQVGLLLGPAVRGEADVVIGSRHVRDSSVYGRSLMARTSSWMYNRIVRALLPDRQLRSIRDTQCGFKLFSRRVLGDILMKTEDRRGSWDTELMALASLHGYRIKEIGIHWVESAQGSLFNIVKDGWVMIQGLLRQRRMILDWHRRAGTKGMRKPSKPEAPNMARRKKAKALLPGLVKGSGWAAAGALLMSFGQVLSKLIMKSATPEGAGTGVKFLVSGQYMFSIAAVASAYLIFFWYVYRKTAKKSTLPASYKQTIFPEWKLFKKVPLRYKVLLVSGSLLAHAIGGTTYHSGLNLLGSVRITNLIFQVTLPLSFIIGVWMLHETLTKKKATGSAMVLIGILAVVFFSPAAMGTGSGFVQAIGGLLVVACAFSYAVRTAVHDRFLKRYRATWFLTLKFGYHLSALVLIFYVLGLQLGVLGHLANPFLMHPLVLVTSLTFTVATLAIYRAQRTKGFGIMHLAPIMASRPIITMLFEGTILKNWPADLALFIGMALVVIIGASIAVRKDRSRKKRSKPEAPNMARSSGIAAFIEAELEADEGRGDVTSNLTIPPGTMRKAEIRTRESGVVAGLDATRLVFEIVDTGIHFDVKVSDGDEVIAGEVLASVEGDYRNILKAERTALNILGHLSGITTATKTYVERVSQYPVMITEDNRVTTPPLQDLERYAIRLGGGHDQPVNQSVIDLRALYRHAEAFEEDAPGLSPDRINRKIKEEKQRGMVTKIIVGDLDQYRRAQEASPDVIVLDGMTTHEIREAVKARDEQYGSRERPRLEVACRATPEETRKIAACGVDSISIAGLTQFPKRLDVALDAGSDDIIRPAEHAERPPKPEAPNMARKKENADGAEARTRETVVREALHTAPEYLMNVPDLLGYARMARTVSLTFPESMREEKQQREELIRILCTLDERDYQNKAAIRLIRQAKKVTFYTEVARETIGFLRKHEDEARVFLIGDEKAGQAEYQGLPDCSLHTYETLRRLREQNVAARMCGFIHRFIDAYKGHFDHFWVETDDGFIIEPYALADPHDRVRVLHKSENTRGEFKKDTEGFFGERVRSAYEFLRAWDEIARILEQDDRLEVIEKVLAPLAARYETEPGLAQKYTEKGTFVRTPGADIAEMLEDAGLEKGMRYFSLGSGLGDDVFIAAGIFDTDAEGKESDVQVYRDSRDAHDTLKKEPWIRDKHISLEAGDYLAEDVTLSDYDVLYWYYNEKEVPTEGQLTNVEALQLKISETIFKPGTRLIVYGGEKWYGFNLQKLGVTLQHKVYYIYEADANGSFIQVSAKPEAPNMRLLKKKKKTEEQQDGDYVNPFIEAHIDAGRAVEIDERNETVRTITRDRTNPRAPPLEKSLKALGIFQKIREAKESTLLWDIVKSTPHLKLLKTTEQIDLVKAAQNVPLSLIAGRVLVCETEREYVFTQTRTGYSKEIHGLDPTIWLGEILLRRMAIEKLAQLLLEESQHIVRPPKFVAGRWINLHRQSETEDAREVIDHDQNLIESLDLSPAAESELTLPVPASQELVTTGKPEPPNMAREKETVPAGSTFVRDLTTPEEVSQNLVEAILSILLTKKLVLAFDSEMRGKALDVLEELNRLKKDRRFEKILKNLEIVESIPENLPGKLEQYTGGSTEVFVFARASQRAKLSALEPQVRATYIDEKEFPLEAYYPLPEIVTIVLAQHLDPRSLENVGQILERLNIASVEKGERGVLVFRLLPDAEKIDMQELIKRYAVLKRLIQAA